MKDLIYFSVFYSCYFSHFYQFFRSSQQNETFFASTFFLAAPRRDTSISPVPSSGHPVARRQEAKRKNSPLLPPHRSPQFFSDRPFPPLFQPPPSRRYLPPPAASSLSSDFPHSIFAISTSDIENSQSGSAAWSYSQRHYSDPLPHRPPAPLAPRAALFSPSGSPLSGFPRLPTIEPSLSVGIRERMRGLVWAQSGSIRRFAP